MWQRFPGLTCNEGVEMFYLTMRSTHLRLYGVRHMIDYSDNKRRTRGKMSARTPPILHFWVELGIDLIMWLGLRPGLGLVLMTRIGLEWYLGLGCHSLYECRGGVVVEFFL